MRSCLLFAISMLTAGCEQSTEIACTLEEKIGITVGVVDAATGAPIRGQLVMILIEDGRFNEAAMVWNGYAAFTYRQEGTYQVSITAGGYRTWIERGVELTREGCQVNTVSLTARLQAEG